MINEKLLKRVKNNNFTLRHIPQAEIDKISQINFIEFVFWLGKDNIIIKNGYYYYSKDESITLYKEMGYNHYNGMNYMPLFFLQCYLDFNYRQALYLLNYFYYKVSKQTVSQELKKYFNQSATAETKAVETDLQYILNENLLLKEETKATAYKKLYAYLTSRGFERFVIQNIISQKWLMIDKNYNLCFITYDDINTKDKVIAITKKGIQINKEYKCNYTAERYTGFIYLPKPTHAPEYLFVFESCLDLFSFVQLIYLKKITVNGEFACISLNSANNRNYINKTLCQFPSINKMVCCLDNDYSGIQATEIIKNSLSVSTYDLRPILKDLTAENGGQLVKDWNEALHMTDKINIDVEQYLGINENQ